MNILLSLLALLLLAISVHSLEKMDELSPIGFYGILLSLGLIILSFVV